MPSPKTRGNINYDNSDPIIEELYNILKYDSDILSIISNYYDDNVSEDENIQTIEQFIDIYIRSNTDLQIRIAKVYENRNVIIPLSIAFEKNEIIDAKKRLIQEEITKLKK